MTQNPSELPETAPGNGETPQCSEGGVTVCGQLDPPSSAPGTGKDCLTVCLGWLTAAAWAGGGHQPPPPFL